MMPNTAKLMSSPPTLLQQDGMETRESTNSMNNPLSPNNTLIIFDWDDTFFPTSALERARLLQIPLQQRLRPQLAQQLNDLAQLCIDVLNFAQKYGKVIIVTNSAPGWLDSSCQTFMPALHAKIRQFPIYAKPISYLLTYKLDVFQREIGIGAGGATGKQWMNLVSVGDGIAERTATLRLVGTVHNSVQRCLKSVKFKDLPTIGQLFEQLELVLLRLDHVATYHGDLDLRSNFPPLRRNPSAAPSASACAFVHLSHLGEKRGPPGGGPQPMRAASENENQNGNYNYNQNQYNNNNNNNNYLGGGNNGGTSSSSSSSMMVPASVHGGPVKSDNGMINYSMPLFKSANGGQNQGDRAGTAGSSSGRMKQPLCMESEVLNHNSNSPANPSLERLLSGLSNGRPVSQGNVRR